MFPKVEREVRHCRSQDCLARYGHQAQRESRTWGLSIDFGSGIALTTASIGGGHALPPLMLHERFRQPFTGNPVNLPMVKFRSTLLDASGNNRPVQDLGQVLSLQRYFDIACTSDQFQGRPAAPHYRELSFGFFGEVGGLLSALKKGSRDQLTESNPTVVAEELGDALWYLVNLSALCDVSVEELGRSGLAWLREYFAESAKTPPKLTFRVFDGITSLHHDRLVRKSAKSLRELARSSGELLARSFIEMRKQPVTQRQQQLGALLGQVALVSGTYRLSFGALAAQNLFKITDRWPGPHPVPRRLERKGEAHEQFPEKMTITFVERKVGGRTFVVQQMHALNIGDPLTDNNHRADGYRYHDVFHLAYAAHLGWSPVLRALLKLKRKSDPKTDENEDGARAIIIEEGIATWIFNHAKHHRNYADVVEGRLEYALLRQVRSMLSELEVAHLPLWQWERAILSGFSVFRQLLANKGGVVEADLLQHRLIYHSPKGEPIL